MICELLANVILKAEQRMSKTKKDAKTHSEEFKSWLSAAEAEADRNDRASVSESFEEWARLLEKEEEERRRTK